MNDVTSESEAILNEFLMPNPNQKGAHQITFKENYGWSNFHFPKTLHKLAEFLFNHGVTADRYNIVNNDGKPEVIFHQNNDTGAPLFSAVIIVKTKLLDKGEWVPCARTMQIIQSENVPVMEFVYPGGEPRIFYPRSYEENEPYEGRLYTAFKSDCYSLIREYYAKELNHRVLPLVEFSILREMMESFGRDFLAAVSSHFGFVAVADELKKNDLIIRGASGIHEANSSDHLMIYMGDNLVLHHYTHRLSTVSELTQAQKKAVKAVMRVASK